MNSLDKLTPRELQDLPARSDYICIPPRYRGAKLTDFDDATRTRALQGATGEGVLLLGGVGSGKTHLAAALLLELYLALRIAERDRVVASASTDGTAPPEWISSQTLGSRQAAKAATSFLFDSVPSLAQESREAATDGSLGKVIDACCKPRLLVLDDLGASRDSQFLEDVLYLIVSHRYNEMLPTIYTTNLSLELLAQRIGERIVSRINGTCLILNLGNVDRRA
jgi:DNA replication protein DnaC